MWVSAALQPEQLIAAPTQPASLSLHLQNNTPEERTVSLEAAGDLVGHTELTTTTIVLEGGQHAEVPIQINPTDDLARGAYTCRVDATIDDATVTATSTIHVGATTTWVARLVPELSSGVAVGRHNIEIDNLGDAPATIELAPSSGPELRPEVAASVISVNPGASANVAARVIPADTIWNGPAVEHEFTFVLRDAADEVILTGRFEQQPRWQPWFTPALVGMLGALVIGLLAWFLIFKPAVEDIARDEAAKLDLEQQLALDERVALIQAAAEQASELPLGSPTDLRLATSAPSATTSSEAFDFDRAGLGRVLSITDVIFQNPTGAVGRLELLRDDQVLLDQEMANFRDLDFHMVAPFRVASESTIALRITCESPGPGTDECQAAATIVGFVADS